MDFLTKEDLGIKILVGLGVFWVITNLFEVSFNFGF